MAQAVAIVSKPYTAEQALAWLFGKSPKIETTMQELARQWGREGDAGRMWASRQIDRWADEGMITREHLPDRRSVIHIHGDVHCAVNIEQPTFDDVRRRTWRTWSFGHAFGAAFVAGLSLAVAYYALRINAWYGASLGRSAEAISLLSGLSVVGDLAAMILPTAARSLSVAGKHLEAVAAWMLWPLTLTPALLAAIGFASVNIADTTAERATFAIEHRMFEERIATLTTERAAIHEVRSSATIEAEIRSAQTGAIAVWSATNGCTDITRTRSAEICSTVLRLRQAREQATRAESIDAELKDVQSKLTALPPTGGADPQTEMAAGLLSWIGLPVTPRDIAMIRIGGMMTLPQISGVLLMLAAALWRARHEP